MLPLTRVQRTDPLWQLYQSRWKLTARASRLGHNVLSVDSDMIFYQDPYVHLKGPLKDFKVHVAR